MQKRTSTLSVMFGHFFKKIIEVSLPAWRGVSSRHVQASSPPMLLTLLRAVRYFLCLRIKKERKGFSHPGGTARGDTG